MKESTDKQEKLREYRTQLIAKRHNLKRQENNLATTRFKGFKNENTA